jgi:hypothetical protein
MVARSEQEEAIIVHPYSDMLLPHRAKLLKLNEEPRVRKSNALQELPNASMPYADKADPKRPKLLIDIALPIDKKSSVLCEDASVLKP